MEHHLFPNGFIDRKECKEIQTKIKVEESGPGQGGRTLNCLTGFSECTKQQFIMYFQTCVLYCLRICASLLSFCPPFPFWGERKAKCHLFPVIREIYV